MTPRILHRDQAAKYVGYEGTTSAFDKFARDMGFRKIPGRSGCYDKKQIDAALDASMGLKEEAEQGAADAWIAANG